MIYGLGLDSVELDRFDKSFSKYTEKWLKKGAHPIEIKLAPKSKGKRWVEYWAARFAVKEAFSKALGTGFGKNFDPKQIGVNKTSSGKPYLMFEKKLQLKLKELKISNTHISITHTEQFASAIVMLEG